MDEIDEMDPYPSREPEPMKINWLEWLKCAFRRHNTFLLRSYGGGCPTTLWECRKCGERSYTSF